MRWNICEHNRICADHRVITYLNGPQNLRSGSDIYSIANNRRPSCTFSAQTNRDAVSDSHIIAEHRVAAHNDPAEVINPETATNNHLTGYLDSREYLNQHKEDLVNQR